MTLDVAGARRESLVGTRVRLEPLEERHVPALARVGLDARIWNHMTHAVTDESGIRAYVADALRQRDAGSALPYATVDAATDETVGTTRFAAITAAHLRAELGWTWLTPSRWRTGINVEAKRLMLSFAFEDLGLRRVEFKTDERNQRSRDAIAGLGATFEGIFRKHMVLPDGGFRNSAYYSITDDDWPNVKTRLDARLQKHS